MENTNFRCDLHYVTHTWAASYHMRLLKPSQTRILHIPSVQNISLLISHNNPAEHTHIKFPDNQPYQSVWDTPKAHYFPHTNKKNEAILKTQTDIGRCGV